MKAGDRNHMAQTADLERSVLLISEAFRITQKQCPGKPCTVGRKDLYNPPGNLLPPEGRIIRKANGAIGNLHVRFLCCQKEDAFSLVMGCFPFSTVAGKTQAELSGYDLTRCNLIRFIEITTHLIPFAIQFHRTVKGLSIIGSIAVIGRGNGNRQCFSVMTSRSRKVESMKSANPRKANDHTQKNRGSDLSRFGRKEERTQKAQNAQRPQNQAQHIHL